MHHHELLQRGSNLGYCLALGYARMYELGYENVTRLVTVHLLHDVFSQKVAGAMAALRGDNASILADFGPHSAANVAPRSTMATAMMFGTIIFASAALAARMYFAGVTRAVTDAQCPRSSPLDVKSFSSIYTLLHHSTIFGLILLYAYICEYHPPFPHANKAV